MRLPRKEIHRREALLKSLTIIIYTWKKPHENLYLTTVCLKCSHHCDHPNTTLPLYCLFFNRETLGTPHFHASCYTEISTNWEIDCVQSSWCVCCPSTGGPTGGLNPRFTKPTLDPKWQHSAQKAWDNTCLWSRSTRAGTEKLGRILLKLLPGRL